MFNYMDNLPIGSPPPSYSRKLMGADLERNPATWFCWSSRAPDDHIYHMFLAGESVKPRFFGELMVITLW